MPIGRMAKNNCDLTSAALVILFVGVFVALYYNEQKRKAVHEAFASSNPMPMQPLTPFTGSAY